MSKSAPSLRHRLLQVSEPVRECLSQVPYAPPEGSNVAVKSMLESLLPQNPSTLTHESSEDDQIRTDIKKFSLCCAALASSEGSTHGLLKWVPKYLPPMAASAFRGLSEAFFGSFDAEKSRVGELGLDCGSMPNEKRLVVELMPEVLPSLKATMKESSIDASEDGDAISAASARVPVAYAIVAAYQFRWFVTQVESPDLGKMVSWVMPCALTALDHWSPEVKGQGMISVIHLVKNVNAAQIGFYEDVILDACCQNIASSDEIWHLVIEMSVLVVTCSQQNNPRSTWYEKMLTEMLDHLERQPRNKERYLPWLQHVEPLFHGLGLVLLAHFRRIFPLFFQWMHADDDQTVVLVLKTVHKVVRLTWIRNTPYVGRLVDDLTVIYKEAALRKAREEIRAHIFQIFVLLQQCKGLQFEAAWEKHRDDPNLAALGATFSEISAAEVVR